MNDGNAGLGFFLIILILGVLCIPGIIATKRNHAYKGVIWALSLVGGLFWGIGWIVGIIWALWPSEKTLADPILGNTTGIGARNTGTLSGENAKARRASSDEGFAGKLRELDELLEAGSITSSEYDALRKKALGL